MQSPVAAAQPTQLEQAMQTVASVAVVKVLEGQATQVGVPLGSELNCPAVHWLCAPWKRRVRTTVVSNKLKSFMNKYIYIHYFMAFI